jgi:Protein of unknown function (DUF2878)
MAKFWNFVLFQLGWFACILGAANQRVFWAVIGSLVIIAFHVWSSPSPKTEISLLLKALFLGVFVDTLIVHLGLINFKDSWPSKYLSPVWMWTLWVLFATTINGSMSWLRGRPKLSILLGSICGPMSYEAGIRLGAGEWGPGGQLPGLIVLALIWGMVIPLFFYWDRTPLERGLVTNQ